MDGVQRNDPGQLRLERFVNRLKLHRLASLGQHVDDGVPNSSEPTPIPRVGEALASRRLGSMRLVLERNREKMERGREIAV